MEKVLVLRLVADVLVANGGKHIKLILKLQEIKIERATTHSISKQARVGNFFL
jgi:hypothetical protein